MSGLKSKKPISLANIHRLSNGNAAPRLRSVKQSATGSTKCLEPSPALAHYRPSRSAGRRAAIVPTATRSPSGATTQTATPAKGPNPEQPTQAPDRLCAKEPWRFGHRTARDRASHTRSVWTACRPARLTFAPNVSMRSEQPLMGAASSRIGSGLLYTAEDTQLNPAPVLKEVLCAQ